MICNFSWDECVASSSCHTFKWDSGPDNFSTCEDASVKSVANKNSSDNPMIFLALLILISICLWIISCSQKACAVLAVSNLFFNMCVGQPTTWWPGFELPCCFWFFLSGFHVWRYCVEWADGEVFLDYLKSSFGEVHTLTIKDYHLSRSWALTTLCSVTDDSVAWPDQMCIP